MSRGLSGRVAKKLRERDVRDGNRTHTLGRGDGSGGSWRDGLTRSGSGRCHVGFRGEKGSGDGRRVAST